MILHSQFNFSISILKTRASLLFTIKINEMFELHAKYTRDVIRWISNDNPTKISLNYAQLCECLDNQPIKITTRFSGSDDATGQH